MQVHRVRPIHPRRDRDRVGRGKGSGTGTYAGKGLKGQKARAGGGVRPGFEGGQNPQIKGLPMMRGFTNIFRTEYQVVNLDRLDRLPEAVTEVTAQVMERYGLVRSAGKPVKVLGQGELSRAFQVQVSRVSQTARAKIEAAGGAVEETVPRKLRGERAQRRRARAAAKAAAKAGAPKTKEVETADAPVEDQEEAVEESEEA